MLAYANNNQWELTFNTHNEEDFPANSSWKEYAFESWIFLRSHVIWGMKKWIEFRWTDHLKINIEQTQNLNEFKVDCVPVFTWNAIDDNKNSATLNLNSEWTHIRCSVRLNTNEFLFTSSVHETSISTNMIVPANRTAALPNQRSLKLVVNEPRMIATGSLFVR